jgi:putative tricarboxylic transport membrane protein
MKRSSWLLVLTAVSVAALSAAGCGGSDGGSGSGSDQPVSRLRLVVPAAPGGGWDTTARAAQPVFESSGAARSVEVVNVPGAGGTIALAQLAGQRGKKDVLMVMGQVMVGAVQTNKSKATLADVTPIARLTSEQEAVVVPADSPYRTVADLVAAWKQDPGKVAIAGGSAGGTDQVLAGLMAQAAGVDPKKVNYVAFSGGGEALAAIIGGKVSLGISGVSEFTDQVRAGKLRALAVSGAERVDGFDAPTLSESGIAVELTNWRGVVAAPGLGEADRTKLERAVRTMHDSEPWKQALAKRGWTDDFLAGPEFSAFLEAEQKRVEGVLRSLGLV